MLPSVYPPLEGCACVCSKVCFNLSHYSGLLWQHISRRYSFLRSFLLSSLLRRAQRIPMDRGPVAAAPKGGEQRVSRVSGF